MSSKSCYHSSERTNIYQEWQILKKSISRKNVREFIKPSGFQKSMQSLFDISHKDALAIIKIKKTSFFHAQRQKGRRRVQRSKFVFDIVYPEKRRVEEKDY